MGEIINYTTFTLLDMFLSSLFTFVIGLIFHQLKRIRLNIRGFKIQWVDKDSDFYFIIKVLVTIFISFVVLYFVVSWIPYLWSLFIDFCIWLLNIEFGLLKFYVFSLTLLFLYVGFTYRNLLTLSEVSAEFYTFYTTFLLSPALLIFFAMVLGQTMFKAGHRIDVLTQLACMGTLTVSGWFVAYTITLIVTILYKNHD